MNRKAIIYWLLIFTGLTYFFFSFASYLFDKQEEMQLFIPQWDTIRSIISSPGGVSRMLGLLCTQYYCFPLVAAIINSLLLTGTGICCYLLLRRISSRGYHLLLSLFPLFILLKAHIQPNYVADGTFSLLGMLFTLLVVFYFQEWKTRLLATIAGALAVYWMSGQLIFLYGILAVVLEYIYTGKNRTIALTAFFSALFLAFIGIRYSLLRPLTEGLKGKAYHEIQLQSDSYVYYIWISFCVVFVAILLTSWLLSKIKWEKKKTKAGLTMGVIAFLFFFSGFYLPDAYDVQNRMTDQLSYLSRRQNQEIIIQMHSGKKIPSAANRNYLNMALAQKGALGNRLFYFDQSGPQSLLVSYNRTYQMSVLLSDIHFIIGDISLSESYAMEGLILARRGGSPRMLQRLIQISLIREEWQLAEKYLSILKKMPLYKKWAIRYENYIRHPENRNNDPELKDKYMPAPEKDELFCLLDPNTIWNDHLTDEPANRKAYEYIGCSLLLAKKNDLFKEFLLQTADLPVSRPLPLHFQEAALMIAAAYPEILNAIPIEPSIMQRYADYIRLAGQIQNQPDGVTNLYRQYGNTYWFYYRYKTTGKPDNKTEHNRFSTSPKF